MSDHDIKPTGCCEPFDPGPWQDKEIVWKEKVFVRDHVTSFLHIPLNMGKKVTRNMELIDKAGAKAAHQLMLSDERSLWGADIYIAVTKDVPGAEMVRISGTFLTKVFEGPYKNIRNWVGEMKAHVESKTRQMKKMYFFYTTCPKCAAFYGKNYVVILAQV